MTEKLIELKNVYAGYNYRTVLTIEDFTICQSDFIGVIGPNGGGKTTLLKILLGLIKPIKGQIIYTRNRKDKQKITIGYLPQFSNIDHKFPITVKEVVLSGLQGGKYLFSNYTAVDKDRCLFIMNQLGIADLQKRSVGELSGGQRQRVLLARAIVSSPQLFLLDEPNTFVDQVVEKELFRILKELNQTMAIVVVSHDIGMISSYVKTIACVNNHLHYHPSNEINNEVLKAYNCPIDLITHGTVPHRVLKNHK